MRIGRTVRRGFRAVLPPAIFLGLAAYCGWNVTRGAHGLNAYAQRQQMLVITQQDQTRILAEQANWEHKIAGLRASHVDLDTLDERARAMLNLADPSDIVVPYTAQQKLF